jgi:hypothetical protein
MTTDKFTAIGGVQSGRSSNFDEGATNVTLYTFYNLSFNDAVSCA